MRRFVSLVLLVVIGTVGAAIAWWSQLPIVNLVSVVRGPVAEVVYATGVVEPVEWARVTPVVRGRIVELCECEGQPVSRGDVIGRIDDAEQRAQAREIEARLAYAERQLARQQELQRRGAATTDALERASAEVDQVRALLAAQRERIDNMVLRAPQDGVVLRRDFQLGEIVGTSDVVAWVGRPTPLRIVADVAEEDIAGVRVGQSVLLRHDGFRDRRLEATVDRITPRGDPVQKVFRVYLSLASETPLRIGMSVEANIVTAARDDALVVPAEAVRDNAVYLVRDGRLVRRPVEVGLRGLRGIELRGGATPGEVVVQAPPEGARQGQFVRTLGERLVDRVTDFVRDLL
jgi:membrane fusion protein (multidrug efflux system)